MKRDIGLNPDRKPGLLPGDSASSDPKNISGILIILVFLSRHFFLIISNLPNKKNYKL